MTEIDIPTGARVRVKVPAIPSVSVPVPPPAGVTVLPVPGPRGADGVDGSDLTPEEIAALTEDVTESVNEALEPPVDLVVWFENQLL